MLRSENLPLNRSSSAWSLSSGSRMKRLLNRALPLENWSESILEVKIVFVWDSQVPPEYGWECWPQAELGKVP